MNPLIFSALISVGGLIVVALFTWTYTRPLRSAETNKGNTETVESAVNSIKSVADARLDQIKLLEDQLRDALQAMAKQKVELEKRIEMLEAHVDELEARNSSLRRRLDRYELQNEDKR